MLPLSSKKSLNLDVNVTQILLNTESRKVCFMTHVRHVPRISRDVGEAQERIESLISRRKSTHFFLICIKRILTVNLFADQSEVSTLSTDRLIDFETSLNFTWKKYIISSNERFALVFFAVSNETDWLFCDVYIHSSNYAQVSWIYILWCLRSLFSLCAGLMDLYSEMFTFILQSMLRSHGPIFWGVYVHCSIYAQVSRIYTLWYLPRFLIMCLCFTEPYTVMFTYIHSFTTLCSCLWDLYSVTFTCIHSSLCAHVSWTFIYSISRLNTQRCCLDQQTENCV